MGQHSDEAGGRIADPWGSRTPYGRGSEWPARLDANLTRGDGEVDWFQSACVLCSNGCGLDIAVADGTIVGVRGREIDHASHGRLGPKGLFGWQANNSSDRLVRPLVRQGGELQESDWETAMGAIVARSRELMENKGGGAFGFYTSGQLFLEEYYTLATIARAGIGTNHLDGNTRLCTATAAAALKESFGCDGQPGSYTDLDHCDCLFMVGHNMAETQTVQWSRVLDRLAGRDRPRLIVVDPRLTATAREADVHLRVKNGTNLPLLNGIIRELIHNDWVDEDFVENHTVGFNVLRATVESYTPALIAELCEIDAADVVAAARLIGTSEALVSTVLQGVYQSHQATAAACQVNNINLLRGMIGKPGATVFQMNGQPTAQNARECGANGDLPGFRNWQNEAHVEDLARIWNVDPLQIPHWGPPTHAMEIFRYAELGSIELLWISGTNPAVSLPDLARIRKILASDKCFVVVQDAFMNETAELADVVLPAAIWGEKLGTFTNADRGVHISEKAVDPPGDARSDLDIWLDYAARMDFRDKDGNPLIRWTDAESTFDAWRDCSKGRLCDYSGLSYDMLRGSGGYQWPVNEEHPDGTERLYRDGRFHSGADEAEDYGHDLSTGATNTSWDYEAMDPGGRAILKAADWVEPHEAPDEQYPFSLTTGRNVYHWHTRTKTARAPELQRAAPDVWVEIATADAESIGIAQGDLVEVESPRGSLVARARLDGAKPGIVFVPFHYGYWDSDEPDDGGEGRAANELTMTIWDPVSKQPLFKTAKVKLTKLERPDASR